jgi:hypothetical protein
LPNDARPYRRLSLVNVAPPTTAKLPPDKADRADHNSSMNSACRCGAGVYSHYAPPTLGSQAHFTTVRLLKNPILIYGCPPPTVRSKGSFFSPLRPRPARFGIIGGRRKLDKIVMALKLHTSGGLAVKPRPVVASNPDTLIGSRGLRKKKGAFDVPPYLVARRAVRAR